MQEDDGRRCASCSLTHRNLDIIFCRSGISQWMSAWSRPAWPNQRAAQTLGTASPLDMHDSVQSKHDKHCKLSRSSPEFCICQGPPLTLCFVRMVLSFWQPSFETFSALLQVILEPGDMLDVPRGLVHYAEVVSKEPCTFFDSSR